MSKTLPPCRPTEYSKAVADRLCAAFGTSTVPLLQMINADPGLPTTLTIHRWCDENADFRRAWKIAARMHSVVLRRRCAEITEAARLEALDLQGRENGAARAKAVRMAAKLLTDTLTAMADFYSAGPDTAKAARASRATARNLSTNRARPTVH